MQHLVLGIELLAGLVDLLGQELGVGMLVERPGLAGGGEQVVHDHLDHLQGDDRRGFLDEDARRPFVDPCQVADLLADAVRRILHEGLLGRREGLVAEAELLHHARRGRPGLPFAHADQDVLDPLGHARRGYPRARRVETAVLGGVVALVDAKAQRRVVVAPGHVLAIAGAVEQVGGADEVPREIGDPVVVALAVGGGLREADDDGAADAHDGFEQGVVAADEGPRRPPALEGLPHQVALELGAIGGRQRLGRFDRPLATGGRARLEDIAHALDHRQQAGVVLVLQIEGTGDIVDDALGQLAGIGEPLVEGLELLLQVRELAHAVRAHVLQGDLEGVARGVGGDRAQELLELLPGDEAEAAGEQIDAAAAGLEGGRHDAPQGLVHDPVAGDERPPGEGPAALAQVGGGLRGVGHGVEEALHLTGDAGARPRPVGRAPRRRATASSGRRKRVGAACRQAVSVRVAGGGCGRAGGPAGRWDLRAGTAPGAGRRAGCAAWRPR